MAIFLDVFTATTDGITLLTSARRSRFNASSDATCFESTLGSDASALHASRELLMSFATVIVPGHGAAFRPDQGTPR